MTYKWLRRAEEAEIQGPEKIPMERKTFPQKPQNAQDLEAPSIMEDAMRQGANEESISQKSMNQSS